MSKYNQFTAMMAIARASFRSITRSPSAVIFTLLFPLIFIMVFGFIGGNGVSLDLAITSGSDRNNEYYVKLHQLPGVSVSESMTDEEMLHELEKGQLSGVITIRRNPDSAGPQYLLQIETGEAQPDQGAVLVSILENMVNNSNLEGLDPDKLKVDLRPVIREGRKFTMIDFILPGQLGFAILSAGVFGTAFVFFNLRQTLVIKRFFATPIRRPFILLGEALSRMVFSLLGSSLIIVIGYFAFGFTLINGLQTAITMLVLAAIGLIVFMGFGFIISGVAKNEAMIPPLANLITLPQFLLSGTFFPIEAFPEWLRPFCRILPLTHLNDALRKIAFEGAAFVDLALPLSVILLWGMVVYALAVKLFRWE